MKSNKIMQCRQFCFKSFIKVLTFFCVAVFSLVSCRFRDQQVGGIGVVKDQQLYNTNKGTTQFNAELLAKQETIAALRRQLAVKAQEVMRLDSNLKEKAQERLVYLRLSEAAKKVAKTLRNNLSDQEEMQSHWIEQLHADKVTIADLRVQLSAKDGAVTNLNSKLEEKAESYAQEVQVLEDQVWSLREMLTSEQQDNLHVKDSVIKEAEKLKKGLLLLQDKVICMNKALVAEKDQIKALRQKVNKESSTIDNRKSDNEAYAKQVSNLEGKVFAQGQIIEKQRIELSSKDTVLDSNEKQIEVILGRLDEASRLADNRKSDNERYARQVSDLEDQVSKQGQIIEEKNKTLHTHMEKIWQLNITQRTQKEEIKKLSEDVKMGCLQLKQKEKKNITLSKDKDTKLRIIAKRDDDITHLNGQVEKLQKEKQDTVHTIEKYRQAIQQLYEDRDFLKKNSNDIELENKLLRDFKIKIETENKLLCASNTILKENIKELLYELEAMLCDSCKIKIAQRCRGI